MAGETTGLVIFSPRSIFEELRGPAGSRLWRPGYLAALVEKHVPLWVITPIAHAAHDKPRHQIVLCNPEISGPLEMDLMPIMASLFSQENKKLKSQAEREGLLHQDGLTWWINSKTRHDETLDESSDDQNDIETLYPSGKLYEMSFKLVADLCRVIVMRNPNSQLFSHDSVAWLRGLGTDVDEFSLVKMQETI